MLLDLSVPGVLLCELIEVFGHTSSLALENSTLASSSKMLSRGAFQMLSEEVSARAARQVTKFTEMYTHAKREVGYTVQALSLPTFDSQEDFDGCRPEEKGVDFRAHNEFIAEVLKGLLANGVPAEPVVFHYSEFAKWLNGREITNDARAAYGGYLLTEAARKKKKS
jgi:hypothetical protein